MASDSGDDSPSLEPSPPPEIDGDHRLAHRIAMPMLRFFHFQTGGGVAMLAATAVALVWANSPWRDSYHALLDIHTRVEFGNLLVLDERLEEWVNDALMVVFFFVVGLEIKRELVVGELRRPGAVALPLIAAVGGMVVPAVLYAAFNTGGEGSAGWGIPMATDIAFALGVVSLLGRHVPSSLKIFLLTLAIVDDIGAILVIAIFYTDEISFGWLALSAGVVLLLFAMRFMRVWYTPVYLVVGVVFWLTLFESGVHATIAGVVMGMFAPARPLLGTARLNPMVQRSFSEGSVSLPLARQTLFAVREHVAVADRLADLLHPWTGFFVVPVFALANAGVELSGSALGDAVRSPVTVGIVVGLVVGKLVGVTAFTWLAVRTGLCELPRGATWTQLLGIGGVAGIGFTVSLFITNLAFAADDITDQAKAGILTASTVAALVGAAILRISRPAGEPVPGAWVPGERRSGSPGGRHAAHPPATS